MRTDYQNINKFEVGIVCVIAIGFVIIGVILFSSLTPRKQAEISGALNMFNIRQEAAETIETVEFVYNIPDEFYKEFNMAFVQVATLPEDTLNVPLDTYTQLYRIVAYVVNNLTDQALVGYRAQNQFQIATASQRHIAYDGKIMGAMINVADRLSQVVVREKPRSQNLDLYYSYPTPDYNLSISRMVERAKSSNSFL